MSAPSEPINAAAPLIAAVHVNVSATLAEHLKIAAEALQAGGATKDEAEALVQESMKNLAQQGVKAPNPSKAQERRIFIWPD